MNSSIIRKISGNNASKAIGVVGDGSSASLKILFVSEEVFSGQTTSNVTISRMGDPARTSGTATGKNLLFSGGTGAEKTYTLTGTPSGKAFKPILQDEENREVDNLRIFNLKEILGRYGRKIYIILFYECW